MDWNNDLTYYFLLYSEKKKMLESLKFSTFVVFYGFTRYAMLESDLIIFEKCLTVCLCVT